MGDQIEFRHRRNSALLGMALMAAVPLAARAENPSDSQFSLSDLVTEVAAWTLPASTDTKGDQDLNRPQVIQFIEDPSSSSVTDDTLVQYDNYLRRSATMGESLEQFVAGCRKRGAACPPRVQALAETIDHAKQVKDPLLQAILVRGFVGSINNYDHEKQDVFKHEAVNKGIGVYDKWMKTPKQVVTEGKGDCVDTALLTLALFKQIGFKYPTSLLIGVASTHNETIVQKDRYNGLHAVVTVELGDGRTWVLNNRSSNQFLAESGSAEQRKEAFAYNSTITLLGSGAAIGKDEVFESRMTQIVQIVNPRMKRRFSGVDTVHKPDGNGGTAISYHLNETALRNSIVVTNFTPYRNIDISSTALPTQTRRIAEKVMNIAFDTNALNAGNTEKPPQTAGHVANTAPKTPKRLAMNAP